MSFYSARQPILNRKKHTVAYELLFRDSLENRFPDVTPDQATSRMITGLQLEVGFDRIADGVLAFINFSADTIIKGYPTLLPAAQTCIELTEQCQPSAELLHKMKRLKNLGYQFALDDFIHAPEWEPYYPLIDYIKIDHLEFNDAKVQATLQLKERYPTLQLIAEKVETPEQFTRCMELGFDCFQGYFFSKPEVIEKRALTTSQSVLAELLNEITKPEPDFSLIAQRFEMDPSLSYKLLRYVQSPLFKRSKPIEDIKKAVTMLGRVELQRLIVLLFAAEVGSNKPNSLILLSMQRAKFCETLIEQMGLRQQASAAFLAGMLSLVDAMLDADLEYLLNELPLSASIREALLAQKGKLADALALCSHIERGEWDKVRSRCLDAGLDFDDVCDAHILTELWADERLNAMS